MRSCFWFHCLILPQLRLCDRQQERRPGVHPGRLCSFSGVSCRFFATVNALSEPIQNFVLNPPHPVGAQPYPRGELACRLEACDVLRRVKNQLLQLPFRQDPHLDDSRVGSISRCPRW
jgi:hypothetical protein